MSKIARFKRNRDARARMQALRSSLASATEESDAGGDREDEMRELLLLQLQSYARDSLDCISSANEVILLI